MNQRQPRTTMGRLLSTFKVERDQARKKLEEDLWKAHDLESEKSRSGYEIHESRVHNSDGDTVIKLELWQKIDEKVVTVSVQVKTDAEEEAKPSEELEDLLDG